MIDDNRRGETAWHMQLIDVLIGYNVLGFDYPMSGDSEQRIKAEEWAEG